MHEGSLLDYRKSFQMKRENIGVFNVSLVKVEIDELKIKKVGKTFQEAALEAISIIEEAVRSELSDQNRMDLSPVIELDPSGHWITVYFQEFSQ